MRKRQRKSYLFIIIQALFFCAMLNGVSYAQARLSEQEEVANAALPNAALPNEELSKEELPNKDFRFITVDKVTGLFKMDLTVYEEMDTASRAVGTGAQGGLCYILKQVGEWLYIESGEVRGFVQSKNITQEDELEKLIEDATAEDGRISLVLNIDTEGNITGNHFGTDTASSAKLATPLLSHTENKAFAYTQTTTQQVVVEKVYLIANSEVDITEYRDDKTRVLGILPEGGLAFLLKEEDGWFYVESGNVRGFVKPEKFQGSEESLEGNRAEEDYALAYQKIEPKENQSLYHTITSTREGDPIRAIRESMVTYVQKFAESGTIESENGYEFMQSIYAKYDHSIPLTREEQSNVGKVIPIEQVRPGDLVFWTYNGTLSEPAMYLGSEKILVFLHAEKEIAIRDMKTSGSIWAIDFLSPQIEEYLGKFKLTAYCKCTQCSGVWSEAPTASGVMPVEGRTVAMWGIPFGTSLLINGEVYVVEDRGTPYGHIDIFMEDHDRCLEFGVHYADVSKLW